MIARLALLAALAGSAVGATVVLADDRAAAPAPAVPTVTPPKMAGQPLPPPVDATDVRLVLRQADPAGGLPWGVRHFGTKAPGGQAVECYELGRLQDDRFGWVDGSGTFAVAPAGHFLLQSACQPARQLRKLGASVMRFTTLALPRGGTPQPLETVSWGIAAPTVRALLPKGEPEIVPGELGLFLQIAKGEGTRQPLTGELDYSDGHRVAFNRMPEPRRDGETPVPGTNYVAARAPDPAGGEPWGLIASRGTKGGLCMSMTGRLVGTRLGNVDRRLGLFYSGPFEQMHYCGEARSKPTRAFPMRIDTGISGGGEEDPRGRIERRVENTRIIFSGRVHADVVSVTIRTPRDVRTLIPSSPAHAILAVYDGRFPGGKVTATARMKDGREVTRTLYSE
jgi:hypothetical protein